MSKVITQVKIGQHGYGIVGIRRLKEELAEGYADKSDAEVKAVMVERLSEDNYIPANVREDYGGAFVREFRKFLGQPYAEDFGAGIEVKVPGTGCSQCRALTQTIMELLTELQLPADMEHVTNIKEIARYCVMGSPALVINGQVMAVGSVPPRERIRNWFKEASTATAVK